MDNVESGRRNAMELCQDVWAEIEEEVAELHAISAQSAKFGVGFDAVSLVCFWLEEHGVSRETAHRLMKEYQGPGAQVWSPTVSAPTAVVSLTDAEKSKSSKATHAAGGNLESPSSTTINEPTREEWVALIDITRRVYRTSSSLEKLSLESVKEVEALVKELVKNEGA